MNERRMLSMLKIIKIKRKYKKQLNKEYLTNLWKIYRKLKHIKENWRIEKYGRPVLCKILHKKM